MTASPSLRCSPLSAPWKQCGGCDVKNLAGSGLDHADASRRWFAALLWRAFPGRSENDVAAKAARALDVSPRQVRNWLRGENSAALHYVTAVMLIAGVEIVVGGGGRA